MGASSYSIVYVPSVAKALRKLNQSIAHNILRAIENLSEDLSPSGCIQLTDGDGELRIRVGDYRVASDVNDDQRVVLDLRLRHCREIYR